MNAIRVLLWKEWREQWPVLLVVAVLIACVAVGQRFFGWWQGEVGWLFCCVVAAWVVGVSGGGSEHGSNTARFLAVNPVSLRLVWLAKLMLGLATTVATVGVCSALSWASGTELETPRLADVAMLFLVSLPCFCISHYYTCWVRTPVSAMGLAVLLGICVQPFVWLNPVWRYIVDEEWLWHWAHYALVVPFSLALLAFAPGRFVMAVRAEGQLARGERAGAFLLPLALIGVVPFAVGVGFLLGDLLHTEPSDFERMTPMRSLGDERLLVLSERAERYKWVPGVARAVLLTVSVGDSGGRLESGDWGRWVLFPLGVRSPNGKYAGAIAVEPVWRDREPKRPETNHLAVIEADTQALHLLPVELSSQDILPMTWLSDEVAAVCWTDKDSQLRYGTWDMRRKALDELRPPAELQKGKTRCLGFLSNPARIAFCDVGQDKRAKPPVYLLDIAAGGVTPIEAPTGFTCGWLFKGTSRLLLTPEPSDSDRPSCLLDLATGEATGLEELVPQPPGGRWAATCVEPTPAGRWLLVCAREAGEALSVWYAVDIGSLEVFCHAPPKPFPVYYQEVDSGIVAQWADGGHRPHLIYYPLRDTDPAKRLVIAWAGQDAATSHSICWLNDHQFVFAAWPSVKDEAVQRAWMRPVVRTCLLLGDVATRQISPLWPSKGLAGECRFVPWPEWEGKKQ